MIESREIKARRENGTWRVFNAELIKHERLMEHWLKRFFARQNAEIIETLSRGTKSRGDWFEQLAQKARILDPDADIDAFRSTVKDTLGDLVDWDRQSVNLGKLLSPMRKQAFDAGTDAARRAYGLHTVQAPEFTRALVESGFTKFDDITDTTQKLLARSVADGIIAGEGRGELVKRVQEYMPDVSDGRAAVIATTEAHASISLGNFEQMRGAGFTSKKWKATLDTDTRDSHRRMGMNDEEVPIDQPFSNGLMYPGDTSGPPGESINCRCVLIPGNKTRKPEAQPRQRNAGLGSGSGSQLDSYKKTRVREIAASYDPKDNKSIDKLLAQYENEIVNTNVEHAYIFTGGKVYHAEGVAGRVHPEKVLELGVASLEGATVMHNHPILETEFTFSEDDIGFAIANKLERLIGCDTQYRYTITGVNKMKLPPNKSIGMVYREQRAIVAQNYLDGKVAIDSIESTTIKQTCDVIGIRYTRRKR